MASPIQKRQDTLSNLQLLRSPSSGGKAGAIPEWRRKLISQHESIALSHEESTAPPGTSIVPQKSSPAAVTRGSIPLVEQAPRKPISNVMPSGGPPLVTTNSFPGRNSLRKVVGSPALIDTGHSDVISKDAAPSETNTAKSEVSALQPASPANSEDTTAHTSIAPSLKSVAAVETADSDLPANTVNSNATIEPQAKNVLADVLTVHDNDAIRGAPQVVDNTINSTQSGAQAAIVSASEGVAPPQDEGDTVCGAPHGITSNNATIIDSAQSVTVSVTIAPALKDEQASKIADETPPLTIYQPPVLKQEGPLLDLATASILSVDKLIVDAPSSSSEALPASRECKAIAPASLDCSPAPSDNPLQPHSVLTAPVALPAAPRVSKPRGAAFYDGLRKRAITSAVAPPENTGMRSPCVERQSLPAPVSMPHVSLAHVSRNAVLLDTDSPAPAGRPRLTSPSAIALASPARSAPCRTPDATRAPHTPSRLGSPYDRAAQAARFAVVSAAPVGQAAIDVCPEWGSSNPSCWDVYPASDVPSSWPPPPSVDVPPTDIMSALVETLAAVTLHGLQSGGQHEQAQAHNALAALLLIANLEE